LGESSSRLFVDLYKSEKKAGNYLVSPFSIQSGLSLLLLGAKDSTSSSLSSLLHINESKAKLVHKEAKNLLDNFNRLTNATNSSFAFVSANNVFLDESVTVKSEYEERVRCFYGSNVTKLSMRRSPDESADQINAWVEQRTRGKIQKLIQSSSLRNSQAVRQHTILQSTLGPALQVLHKKGKLHYGVRQCDGGGHDAARGKASHWTCPGGEGDPA